MIPRIARPYTPYLGRHLSNTGASHIPGTHVMLGDMLDLSVPALRANEVTHVLLVGEKNDFAETSSQLKSAGIALKILPLNREQETNMIALFDHSNQFINDAKIGDGKVLVAGGSSSLGVAVAYVMSERAALGQGSNLYEDALRIVQEARVKNMVEAIPSWDMTMALMDYNQELGGNEDVVWKK